MSSSAEITTSYPRPNYIHSPSFVYHIVYQGYKCAVRSFFKVHVINRELLLDDGPCIVVANHQSFVDPPIIGQLYETDIHFLARSSLWKPKFMSMILPFCQCIGINQARPDPSSIIKVIRTVRAGGRILIFPEGARSTDGEIHDAMPGIGLILSKLAGVPIQPIRIAGAFECMPVHAKMVKFTPMTVSIGKPYTIEASEFAIKGRAQQRLIGKRIMDSIKALPIDC